MKKDSKISEEEIKTLIAKASKGELEVDELKQILIKKLGISEEEVEQIISEAKSKGEDVKKVLLAKVLEETTTLSNEEVTQVVQQVQERVRRWRAWSTGSIGTGNVESSRSKIPWSIPTRASSLR